MALIYKIANDINNKVYVGQTIQTLKKRIYRHLQSVRYGSNFFIHNAIRKYGWKNFKVEILEDNIPLENLNERELYWTEKFNALAPNGYVLIAGGEPRIISEETKKKMSCVRKDKKSVICFNNDGIVAVFPSIKEASIITKISLADISKVCHGKRKTAGKFNWKFNTEKKNA